MPRIANTTNAQTKFLRAFRTASFGPNVSDWPSAAIMRRWLRKPGFVVALRSVTAAMRVQADVQLLSAAAAAAHVLHTAVTDGSSHDCKDDVKVMSDVIKMLHMRERFSEKDSLPPIEVKNIQLLGRLRKMEPDTTVAQVLRFYDRKLPKAA